MTSGADCSWPAGWPWGMPGLGLPFWGSSAFWAYGNKTELKFLLYTNTKKKCNLLQKIHLSPKRRFHVSLCVFKLDVHLSNKKINRFLLNPQKYDHFQK